MTIRRLKLRTINNFQTKRNETEILKGSISKHDKITIRLACNNSYFSILFSMNTIQSMRVFVRVAQTRSFTAAADQLGASKAHISRSIANLELHLQTRLLDRSTRRVGLTPKGARYLAKCEHILACIDDAEFQVRASQDNLSGKLRIHSAPGFGQSRLMPMIGAFQQHYPGISVELTLGRDTPDLFEDGFDIAVIVTPELPPAGLISHLIKKTFSIVCATPRYLVKNGTPHCLDDLNRHICVKDSGDSIASIRWRKTGQDRVEKFKLPAHKFSVNLENAVATAIREDMGIGLLPVYVAEPDLRSRKLVHLLPEFVANDLNIFASYTSLRSKDVNVKTWIDFAKDFLVTSDNPYNARVRGV